MPGSASCGSSATSCLVRRRDIANHVRKLLAERINPRGADIDHDAGQLGGVHLDARHLVPAEEIPHQHRNESAMPPHVAQNPRALAILQRHNAPERVERRVDVVRLLGDQHRAPGQLVARNRGAEPIQNPPTRRRDRALTDPICLGQRGIAPTLQDLHLVQPGRQPTQHRHLPAHQQQRTARKHPGPTDLAPHHPALLPPATRRSEARSGLCPETRQGALPPGPPLKA